MFKKIILFFVKKYLSDRDFRISIFKEVHKESQEYFGEQTVPGRFYEICEEFFQAGPPLLFSNTKINLSEAVAKTYTETIKDVKCNPEKYFKTWKPIDFDDLQHGMYIRVAVGFDTFKSKGFIRAINNNGDNYVWINQYKQNGDFCKSWTASKSYCKFEVCE